MAHRSDLAYSELESNVLQVRINLKSVATFYRASGVRTNELIKLVEEGGAKFVRFPEHFEVRFVEHLVKLCNSVWRNLPCIRQHWKIISEKGDRNEKGTAKGFLRMRREEETRKYILLS